MKPITFICLLEERGSYSMYLYIYGEGGRLRLCTVFSVCHFEKKTFSN